MDICFLITTYNRQESCQRLVNSLQGLGDIVVLHDGNDYEIEGANNIRLVFHQGKPLYWKTVNILFKKRKPSKYYFMLPDDFAICELQIVKSIETWESIQDPRKICLNLFADRIGKPCWTGFKPISVGNVWKTQWVDMCFICEERFFTELGVIPKIVYDWRKHPWMSSGVGAYISRLLNRRKFSLYQVKESLAIPTDEHNNSKMKNAKIFYDQCTFSHNTHKRRHS